MSLIGAALVTLSALLFLFVYLLELFGAHSNPYIGMVFFLVDAGDLRARPAAHSDRHVARAPSRAAGITRAPGWPVFDLNDRHVRRHARPCSS